MSTTLAIYYYKPSAPFRAVLTACNFQLFGGRSARTAGGAAGGGGQQPAISSFEGENKKYRQGKGFDTSGVDSGGSSIYHSPSSLLGGGSTVKSESVGGSAAENRFFVQSVHLVHFVFPLYFKFLFLEKLIETIHLWFLSTKYV